MSRELDTMYRFKPGSSLQAFLSNATGELRESCSLGEILTLLKDLIKSQGLFDMRNPSVILCSPSLEQALDRRALHVTEVKSIVKSQLDALPSQDLGGRSWPKSGNRRPPSLLTGPGHSEEPGQSQLFRLRSQFLDVLRTVSGQDCDQTIFSYQEITSLLSRYIISKEEQFLDRRNIRVALVEGDPLGIAFNVSAFHRSQVHSFIRSQLIPVSDGSVH